ncbi:MAG: CPBP family intramembrane metalloprotease [Kiritimatiellae bacterium]|nr:CPBP family intramembrane metalloprotease [Kiritimatiellia bacterium]
MKIIYTFFRYCPHIVATLVVALFCAANTSPAIAAATQPHANSAFTAMLLGQAVSLPLLLLPVFFTLGFPERQEILRQWFARPPCSVSGILYAFLLMTTCSYILLIVIEPSESQSIVAIFQLLSGWQIIIFSLFVCIIVPIIEELLFRGVLMMHLPKTFAIIISAILFGLAHGINAYVLPLLFTGWMLALIRYRSESLIPSICCHALFNTLSLFFALAVK